MNAGRPAPLAGVRVLDLSRVLAGPWAGQLLADYGADVIKVERPGSGDDTRGWGPPWWGDPSERMSAYYLSCNRGKRSVAVDIASAEGAEFARTLARDADVVIENYKVGQLAKYGLDYASLSALNPRLVYCSITGYGQDGPYAHAAGYDFAIQATGGLMSITGEKEGTPGTEPQKVGVAVADLFTGLYATTAILAALRQAETSGRGCHIDAALLDTQIAMLANQASNHLVGGITPQRMGNAHVNIVPYQVMATADGHIVLAVGNDGQFQRLCQLVGEPELAQDPRYATNSARIAHRDELVPIIATWMRTRTTQAWCDLLEPNAVPCAPILNLPQVFAHPQVVHRGMQAQLPDARGRALPTVPNPMRFDGVRAMAPQAPPTLDEDGAAIRAGQGWKPR
ncbi:MAG: CoA transferase [Burkholderiales bacterium]|nr:CoA transferase [Burkholderiales bacterium]MCZ2440285.1 CoA transferase [Burkholderiales bacterium]